MGNLVKLTDETNQKVLNNLDQTNEKVTETGAINSPDFSSRNMYSS